ncbi:redoxin domain-containing protein [Candidatus Bathyarchaeota archaeon]|nr:redoxin domain-containing protein [Candidatus Bathyarchaeota archaeon]
MFHHGRRCEGCRNRLKQIAYDYPEYENLDSKTIAISTDTIEERLVAE